MRRGLRFFAASCAWFALVPFALFACGDDDAAPGPKDSGVPEANFGEAAPSTDSSMPVRVGGCTSTDFDAAAGANGGDLTAQKTVEITFPMGPSPAQYTNRCIKVKVGTIVTFTGSFSGHPLEAKGGDSPSPIPVRMDTDPDGGSLPVTFAAAGTFGYDCMFHPGIMFGAVQVVP